MPLRRARKEHLRKELEKVSRHLPIKWEEVISILDNLLPMPANCVKEFIYEILHFMECHNCENENIVCTILAKITFSFSSCPIHWCDYKLVPSLKMQPITESERQFFGTLRKIRYINPFAYYSYDKDFTVRLIKHGHYDVFSLICRYGVMNLPLNDTKDVWAETVGILTHRL